MKTILSVIVLTLYALTPVASAGDLKKAFDVYTSSPSTTFDGSKMRGVVGASFHARNPHLFDRQLYSIQLPTWNAGCGGIDFFSGSFSTITKDELVQMARGIAQGAPGYFFGLALDSVCSGCGAQLKELQRSLNQFNSGAIDACNTFWDKATDMTGMGQFAEKSRAQLSGPAQLFKTAAGHVDDFGQWITDMSTEADDGKKTPDSVTKADIEYIENNAIYEVYHSNKNATYTPIVGLNMQPYEMYMSLVGRALVTVNGGSASPQPTREILGASVDLADFIYGPETGTSITLTKCAGTTDRCMTTGSPSLTWEGLIPYYQELLWKADGSGILQQINRRDNITQEQVKFIETYPNNYLMYASDCFIGAAQQVSRYLGSMIALNAVERMFSELLTGAEVNLINSGLEANHMVTPDELREQIRIKREELNNIRDAVHLSLDKEQVEFEKQTKFALALGQCSNVS